MSVAQRFFEDYQRLPTKGLRLAWPSGRFQKHGQIIECHGERHGAAIRDIFGRVASNPLTSESSHASSS